jgi:hypothetical protein
MTLIATLAAALTAGQAMELAHRYLAQVERGETDEVWMHMTPPMQAALKDRAAWSSMPAQLKAQLGNETAHELERVLPGVHMQIYTRLSRFSKAAGSFVTTMAIDDQSRIAGYSIAPLPNPAESSHLDHRDKTRLRLPCRGRWLVYQGGRSTYDNYHAVAIDQRFAYDLVAVQDGKLYATGAATPGDFYGFGQPVLAPSDGVVAEAVDRYDDNPIGKPSQENPRQGNSVVIDHGNGEFSMIAHLQRGSVEVKAGQRVKAGQPIARCGNSGNSPFPHIHHHLQTTKDWFNGEGLPMQFTDYSADGKTQASGEPVRGQTIEAR